MHIEKMFAELSMHHDILKEVITKKVWAAAANSYIRIMLDFNLIKSTPQQYVFQIADPKLKYLIDQGIQEI
ncbi:hypothetical protein [Elizabethkingia anophelis]|uniref:Uncharacterized protein n=1 Tax=Elizabethkingia anophelis TaxID=1117645 RepID=A0A7Z7M172_9FLAO|nr:hypothetical protein [Elizabethkingia anophelis]MCT3845065.1 hypothetical protein [Elizabethkingia anophelis]STF08892.1 Uncharacterised protein [Elizabethkingia anophelis]